ncbi:CehA/McbA family metallohydrolase [Pseudoduganella violaceinigra]|uniref:CehA/McbA family metallohydrolase n=1 Tax=Pseudoduganella violaceinigra TaxID=246602 RepID=UPI000401FF4E|nr:CehA/McbA family metallohydrolase [Pseudoduganella violaceinigra]
MKNRFHILPASRTCRNILACMQCAALGLATSPGAAAHSPPAPPPAPILDHREFDAGLEADFQAPATGRNRTFIVHFTLPGASAAQRVDWTVGLYRQDGKLINEWRGRHVLHGDSGKASVRWRPSRSLPAGIYELRLEAGGIHQRRPIAIGHPALLLAPAAPPAAAVLEARRRAGSTRPPSQLAGLDFDIVYGNLHSQTNHSDGGGDPAQCHGAQHPQSGAFGPEDAFQFAKRHGLDFLMTSEHNHMYDGSDGTDPDADPQAARQRYRLGLDAAERYSAGHPGFAAIYGLEWGVISGGGHLNILNSPALLGWERSSSGEPFADVLTPKNDYAALYTLMKDQGWIGQFNHPGSGQFAIGGQALAFSQDGAQAMALCEVMNSNAFSARLDEGEARHSFYEDACDKLLEAGYKLAFSSNQDNHCANWGAAYGNRTGILLPAGTALKVEALLDAIRARHVFATMDKHGAIALTANDALMGATIDNAGPLALAVHYTSSTGRGIAALQIMEGVPGRQGEVTPLPDVAGTRHSFTPAPGMHFYYARLTQDDGRQLWSAPVWVNQH